MTYKDFYRREIHVMLHGQSRNFRIVKWVVILGIVAGLYTWRGLIVTMSTFLICVALGVALHFFLRSKTDRWTKSWGPYKRIRLEDE